MIFAPIAAGEIKRDKKIEPPVALTALDKEGERSGQET